MGENSKRERTFQLEDTLPSLPVPELDKTLEKYIESVKVFATGEVLENTKKIVEDFQHGVGKKLQEKLEAKAKNSRNWLETWWEDGAYLQGRGPMVVMGNMHSISVMNQNYWPLAAGTQIKRAAQSIYAFTSYFLMSRREELPIVRDRSNKPTSMHQYKSLFCASRIPGDPKDTLVSYFKTEAEGPCPTHFAVFCNGHIFKMDMFDKNGDQAGSREIERQLIYIKTQSRVRGQCIGTLTADDRSTWAKVYRHLESLDPKNKDHLHTIQSALFLVYIDAQNPGTMAEVYHAAMCGENVHDRWLDKSTGTAYFANGAVGYVGDHCSIDGITVHSMEQWLDNLVINETAKHDWMGTPNVQSDDIKPEEIIFTIDSKIEEAKVHAAQTYAKHRDRIDPCPGFFSAFGRNFPKEQRIHPDAFLQMAIQLAYYTKYGKPAPCYESATTRQYYHGRTETLRSTTQEAVDWCKAMNNDNISVKEKMSLLQRAVSKHLMMGFDCLQGKGTDRHLLGLYMTSLEMGIDVPALFTDPMYTKSGGNSNFKLSTSLTGYMRGFGGVVPMHKDGYSVFYNLCKEEFFIVVISFKDSQETDSLEFFQEISKSLIRMRDLILEAKQ